MNNIIKNGQYKMERTLNAPLNEHTPVYVSIDELDRVHDHYEGIVDALRCQSDERLKILDDLIVKNSYLLNQLTKTNDVLIETLEELKSCKEENIILKVLTND
jgi:hypothetical protein